MLEQAHERRWSGATEYPNRLEWSGWSGVGGVEWQFWEWSAPKQALSRTKTEYMMYDFSATRHEGGDVSLDGQVVVQKDTFRYLGSVLQKDGDIDEDVRHRISAGWLK